MQKTKLGPAEMLSLVPIALLISSGFASLLIYILFIGKLEFLQNLHYENISTILTSFFGYALLGLFIINIIIFILVYQSLQEHESEFLHKLASEFKGTLLTISLYTVLLLIIFVIFSLFISLIKSKLGFLQNLSPGYMTLLSAGILLFTLLMLIFSVRLSEIEMPNFIRSCLLPLSRWLGKILGWFCSGWRTYAVRLFDVLFVVWVTESLFNLMAKSWSEGIVLNGTLSRAALSNLSLINATISSNNTSFTGCLLNTTQANGTLINGLLIDGSINGSLYDGFLINANLSSYYFFNGAISSIFYVAWSQWEEVLAIWFLFEVIRFSYNVSQRMVIDDFIDYTKVDETKSSDDNKAKHPKSDSKSPTSGLADLLVVKLSRISELYRIVDEKRAIESECGAGKPLDANIKAEGTAELLKSAVSSESKLTLGPVTIPTGSITGLVGHIMQGPRIIVSLHMTKNEKNEDIFFLTANMVGGKESFSWLVQDQKSLEDDSGRDKRSTNDMVIELAHRIFAKLSFDESNNAVPWRAVWNFNEGLRDYRDCLHSVKQRRIFLKQAEKRFIEVLEDDDDFDLAYYNLGVVYSELKQSDAAEISFSKAIELNQKRLEAYYALGLNLFEKAIKLEEQCNVYGMDIFNQYDESIIKQYEKVILLCDHVIHIKEKESNILNRDYDNLAKALNLKGHAQSHINLLKGDYNFDSAIKSSKKAVDYSWRALFRAEIQHINTKNIINTTSECLIDLADSYLEISKKNKSRYPKNKYQVYAEKLIKQAIYIDPVDANLRSELGKVYCSMDRHDLAASAFKCAVRISPEKPEFYAYLARAYAYDEKNTDLALHACENASYYGLGKSNQALLTAAEVYRKLGYSSQDVWLKRAAFLEELKSDEKRGATGIRCLKRKLENLLDIEQNKEWESAEVAFSLMRLYLNSKDQECKKCWKNIVRPKCIVKKKAANSKEHLAESERKESWRKIIEETSKLVCKNEYKKCSKILEKTSWAIFKLREKTDGAKKDIDEWEKAQDNFALGCIYLEFGCDCYKDYFEKSIKIMKDKLELLNTNRAEFEYACNFLNMARSCINHKDQENAKKYIQKVQEYLSKEIEKSKPNSQKPAIEDRQILSAEMLNGFSIRINKDLRRCGEFVEFIERPESIDLNLKNKNYYEYNMAYLFYVRDYSRLLIELSKIYIESNKIKEENKSEIAYKYIREAIDLLERDYPEEIGHHGLRSLLARSLREQKKHMAVALKEAQDSCVLNPLRYDERRELGRTFYDLEEIDLSLSELDNAFSWKPDDPDILVEMGRVCLIRAQKCCEEASMKKALDKASKYLKEALEIYDKSQIRQRGKARYWLGRVHIISGDYVKAIPHFSILHRVKYYEERNRVCETSTLEQVKTDKTWMIATLQLAHAYLKIKAYDECEMYFDQIIENIDDREICKIVGNILDDRMYLGEIFAWAYLGKAFCSAERDSKISCPHHSKKFTLSDNCLIDLLNQGEDYSKLDDSHKVDYLAATSFNKLILKYCPGYVPYEYPLDNKRIEMLHLSDSGKAKIWIIMARHYIRQLKDDSVNKTSNVISRDLKDIKRNCLAACDDCMGWILYKQDNIEEAIGFLCNSASLKAKAIYYLHLALAYERKLKTQDLKGRDRSLEVRQALAFCKHAERLDIKKEFSESIKEVRKNLGEGKSREPSKDDTDKSNKYALKCELEGSAKGMLSLNGSSDKKKEE